MKTMSAVVITSAADGDGSKVWELVPSGTMPTISARSPMMFAAMEVIGATVVTTWRSVVDPCPLLDEDASSPESAPPQAAVIATNASPIDIATTRVGEVDDFQSIHVTLVATSSQQDVVPDIR